MFPFVGENLQPVVEQARRHLAFWKGFPVETEPRPIVMLGETTLAPDTGFPSNETKEAFLQAAFTMECDAPPSAPDDTIVTPAVALERFRDTGSGSGAEPLTITGIRLDAGTFITDRGRRDLPAWAIQFREVDYEAKVVALRDEFFFPLPAGANLYPPLGVIGSEDSTEVRVHFTAGPPESQDFDVVTIQDSTGVAVILRMVRNSQGPGPHIALGYPHEVAVELAEPIGHRVVLDGRTGALTALHP